MAINKQRFWNKKIIPWENARYRSLKPQVSGKILPTAARNSVQSRLLFAAQFLSDGVRGASVLDLGCGTGRFLKLLRPFDPVRLVGIDLSPTAIAKARRDNPDSPFEFLAGDISSLELPTTDYVVSLGLIDWLDRRELDHLFAHAKDKKFIFSFSERRNFWKRLAHCCFVILSYGWRTKGYIPAYHTATAIRQIAGRHSDREIYFFRHQRLSFSTLVSNFPLVSR